MVSLHEMWKHASTDTGKYDTTSLQLWIYERLYPVDLLSVKTHRRVATGNTKSREVAGVLAGTAPSSTARNSVTCQETP